MSSDSAIMTQLCDCEPFWTFCPSLIHTASNFKTRFHTNAIFVKLSSLNAPSLQTDKMQIQRQRMKEIVVYSSWRDVYCSRDWILINVMLSTHVTLYPLHRWQEKKTGQDYTQDNYTCLWL